MEIKCAEDIINNAKDIDAEPVKHAHLEVIVRGLEEDNHGNIRHWTMYKCTRCGNLRKVIDMYIPNYCEECGAKMDDEEEKA